MEGTIIQQVVLSNEQYNSLINKIDRLTEAVGLKHEKEDDLLTTKQVMEYLKCGQTALWKWRNDEGMPFKKIGKKVYYSKKEVTEWLKKR